MAPVNASEPNKGSMNRSDFLISKLSAAATATLRNLPTLDDMQTALNR
ncbi:MAG: hypothetical protein WA431_00560 [Candidatus Cybelea sp.]